MRAGATENDVVAAMMSVAIAAGSEYLANVERTALGRPARHLASAQDRKWRPRVLGDGRGARPLSRRAHALSLARPATRRGKAHDGHLPRRPRRRARRPQARQTPARTCTAPARPSSIAMAIPTPFASAPATRAASRSRRTGASLYDGVKTLLRPGMVFHIPPALRVYGKFTVAVSETALVTETGCEQLGTFPGAGDPVSGQSPAFRKSPIQVSRRHCLTPPAPDRHRVANASAP
jgi:Xaa-Pro dipeptidase